MQSKIIKFIILPSILVIIFATVYYNQVEVEINKLIDDKYTQAVKQDKRQLSTLIQEKQENILAVSLAVSKYKSITDVLRGQDTKQLKLKELAILLKDATPHKDLWFQIISKDGTSLYRSFS